MGMTRDLNFVHEIFLLCLLFFSFYYYARLTSVTEKSISYILFCHVYTSFLGLLSQITIDFVV